MAKKKDQVRVNELEDMRAVMATGPGFRLLKRLIGITGPFRLNFNRDHATHAFLDGERSVGSRIMADMLEASPELATRILIETSAKKTNEEATNVHTTEEPDETPAD